MIDRRGMDVILIVRNDLDGVVAEINGGLEDLYLEVCDLCPFQPADQFLSLAGKHRTADHLDPSTTFSLNMWFNKHFDSMLVAIIYELFVLLNGSLR